MLSPWILSVALFTAGADDATIDVPAALHAGDELARAGRYGEALERWRDAYVTRLLGIRDMPFLYRVEVEAVARETLEERFGKLLEKDYPPERCRKDAASLRAFGFFGAEFDYCGLLSKLFGEEVGGFYDPDTKRLSLVIDSPKPQSWWQKALGASEGFDASEAKSVLAHELSHALMDQYFDLHSLGHSFEVDDDAMQAFTCLTEGEAMLSMLIEMEGGEDRSILRAPPDFLAGYFKLVLPLAVSWSGGKTFRSSPLVVRESLIFPYISGVIFCLSLTGDGSWQGVNDAFRAPPLSTEQILHPEAYPRFPGGGDPPSRVILPASVPEGLESWELLKENVLGEFQTEVLLRGKLGKGRSARAAAGWDGDLYRVYGSKSDSSRIFLLWASVWDGEGEASEFYAAAREFYGASTSAESPDEASGPLGGVRLRKWGSWVAVAIGAAEAPLVDASLDWARGAEARAKTIEFRSFESSVSFPRAARERGF